MRVSEQPAGSRVCVVHPLICSLLTACCLLTACVPVDQLPAGLVPKGPDSSSAVTTFPDLEQGGTSITTTHFVIKGYSQTDLDTLKLMAENELTKIGSDTGLYSYLASQNYTLVAYHDRDEFMKKTHEPVWSHVAISGKSLAFYFPDNDLEPILAHFMMHMVFQSYVGDKARTLKWVDEGLAMNQEVSKMTAGDQASYAASKSSNLRLNRMPFSQMTFFVTQTEEKRRTDVWYQEVESVMTYLLGQGSPLAFAQFLSELRSVEPDQAVSDAYAAKFRNLADLEAAWKYTI